MKLLNHQNVNTIIGACVEPNNVYILSPYCSKGSLSDVLENDNIKLDGIFKLAFASDIAQVSLLDGKGHWNKPSAFVTQNTKHDRELQMG